MPNTRGRWRNFGDVLILPVKCSIGSAAITSATWISLRIALKWIRINAESHLTGMQSVLWPRGGWSREALRLSAGVQHLASTVEIMFPVRYR
jgi:hypothetical protein